MLGADPISKPNPGEVKLGWKKPDASSCRLIGRTRGDEIVIFEGKRNQVGDIVKVRATGATNLTIQAELVPETRESSRTASASADIEQQLSI